MAPDPQRKPRYKRYRAGPRLPGRRTPEGALRDRERAAGSDGTRWSGPSPTSARHPGYASRIGSWVGRLTPRRALLGLLAFVACWLALSLVLFLISSALERTSLPGNVASVLDPAGYPLTSANNILVLGSDRRQKDSKEPGAETTGFGRSDTIMLIRTGGGHAARLSIPRDTVIEIPGHGLQKINAAHEFGGPALSVSVIEHWLGHPDQPCGGSQLRKLPAADRSDGRRELHRAAASSPTSTAARPTAASRCA